jgi:hypothetical protein
MVSQEPEAPLSGPKVVVFTDTGDASNPVDLGPPRMLFADALKARGFRVKRFAKTDGSIRYAIELRGAYRLPRCRDGGFFFSWFEAYVIDLVKNETVMVLRGDGYTEGCILGKTITAPREEGTLMADLANLLAGAWGQLPEPTHGKSEVTDSTL